MIVGENNNQPAFLHQIKNGDAADARFALKLQRFFFLQCGVV